MTITKRSKNSRQRGTTTHGCGSMKKRRGAGHRGGRGNSGSGKRGDQKKPNYWTDKKKFGKYGFTTKSRSIAQSPINIKRLEDSVDTLVQRGLVEKKGDTYIVDLIKIGYNKLLSTGTTTKKYKITAIYATEKAKEKISKAGGEVIVQSFNQKVKTEASKE